MTAELRAAGQAGVDAAAAFRRLRQMPPEVVETVRADAERGVKVRHANPKGRPRKDRPDDAELWAECEAERAKVRRPMSTNEAAGIVARRHGLSAAHVMKLTRPYRSG